MMMMIDDDCDESNVDSLGKVQPSLMWGHFCCATHHPPSRDDDHAADDHDSHDDFYILLGDFCDDDFDISFVGIGDGKLWVVRVHQQEN